MRRDGIEEALRVLSRGGNGRKRGIMRCDGIGEALRVLSRGGNGICRIRVHSFDSDKGFLYLCVGPSSRALLSMEDNGNIVIYEAEGGDVRLDVRLENDTVWLTQQQLSLLYGRAVSTINEHIKDIFESEELSPDTCVKKFGNSEFQQKAPFYYNLDVIISVGYRVKSIVGTRFRQWATKRLNEYIRKGFTMDDERLKEMGGGGYWKELLNRIRDIRAPKKSSIARFLTYTLPVSTMTPKPISPLSSSNVYRTRFTMPSTVKLLQR